MRITKLTPTEVSFVLETLENVKVKVGLEYLVNEEDIEQSIELLEAAYANAEEEQIV